MRAPVLNRLLPLLLRQAAPKEWGVLAATAHVGVADSLAAAHGGSNHSQAGGIHTSCHQLMGRPAAAARSPSKRMQPAESSFTVQVAIKAFEERYLDQASNTIADLMFIHFSPKSATSQPASQQPHGPSNLSMTLNSQRVFVDWKKTRFTILKGPHIDKVGMEAFEMRKYKAVATATTSSAKELEWFLDSVRLYQFPGVQVQVLLTSSAYLTPTQLPTTTSTTAQGGLLTEHRQQIARYLGPKPAAGQQQTGLSQEAAAAAELRDTLGTLRQVLYAGFQNQRQQLSRSQAYSNWLSAQKLSSSPSLTAPEPANIQGTHATDHMLSVGHDSAAGRSTQQGALPEHAKQAAAFLAAADAVLLGLNLQALEGYKHFPYHFATYRVGQHQAPAAEWMQAVLQASHAATTIESASKEAELQAAYASYSLFSHSLLSNLFKLWVQQTSAQLKPHLALPSQEQVTSFMQQPMLKQ